MKTLFGAVLFLIPAVCFSTSASTSAMGIDSTEAAPNIIDVLPSQVFAPPGFDDNDNVQLIVDGALPDTCYKQGPTGFRVDKKEKKIYLRQKAYVHKNVDDYCLEVVVRYTQSVSLGILEEGTYEILAEGRLEGASSKDVQEVLRPFGNVTVTASPSKSTDNFLYAAVDSVHVDYTNDQDMSAASANVVLNVSFPSACWKMKEVRINRVGSIIEVLPIAEVIAPGKCAELNRRETHKVVLGEALKANLPASGRYLLHVRSLNGNALNLVAEFY